MSERAPPTKEPVPAVLKLLLSAVAVTALLMWFNATPTRAIWWFGVLATSAGLGVLCLWIRDTRDYESSLRTAADLMMRLLFLIAAAVLLFGLTFSAVVILKPFGAMFGGRQTEDLPENWRR